MPTKYYGVPTNIGTAAIANAALFGVKLDIKTFVVGDGGGSYYQPTPDMTALRREMWRGNIALCEVDETMANVINVGAYMPSDVGGFTAREIGALNGKGQLIGVANIPDAQIVKFEDGVTDETMFILSFAVTNPEVFNWYADPTVIIASKADIEKHNKIATSHQDIRDMLGSLKEKIENISQIKVSPLRLAAGGWKTWAGGGFYYEIEIDDLKETHYVEVKFDVKSLDAMSVCGFSADYEVLNGKIRFRSESVPDTDLTGECVIIAESGDFNPGTSSGVSGVKIANMLFSDAEPQDKKALWGYTGN